jgi:hypothetical protein
MKHLICLSLVLLLMLNACKEGDEIRSEEDNNNYSGLNYTNDGSMSFELKHYFKEDVFSFDSIYITPSSDTIKLTHLLYYFSNVQLLNKDDVWVNLKNYNLVNYKNPNSLSFTINNVPKGIYKRLRFYVGVDSVANSSGAQEGDLSPIHTMFWTWNTGYVFFRIKGGVGVNKEDFVFDVGGNQNLPVIEFDLNSYKLKGNKFTIDTRFDLNQVFTNPVNYDLKTMPREIHTSNDEGTEELKANMEKDVFSILSIK